MEPIGEHGYSLSILLALSLIVQRVLTYWPHRASEQVLLVHSHENIEIKPPVVCRVILLCHCWIDHHDIMLLPVVEILSQVVHALNGEPGCVQRERPPSIHVVDIGPDGPCQW